VNLELAAVTLAPGHADGAPLLLEEPLSFWGGLDPTTGRIIDRWHPQAGARVAGHVLPGAQRWPKRSGWASVPPPSCC
jgi:predicted aconitase with swiveling domain